MKFAFYFFIIAQIFNSIGVFAEKVLKDSSELNLIKWEKVKNYFFINISKISSLTDACYRLRSYERGVAQLGSAGALGASTLRT